MGIKATLYKNSKELNTRSNLPFIEESLDILSKKNILEYQIVDTNDMTEQERMNNYITACLPSVKHKYRVRTVFGTNRQSGIFFGKHQPALYLEGDLWHVCPHEKNGTLITIEEFLSNLLKN